MGELTDRQLVFLHAAWVDRQKTIRPKLDPDVQEKRRREMNRMKNKF
jgi:hypothetical protein